MADTTNLAPWGVAPTVVLPRWYVKNLADRSLPVAVQKMNPMARTIGGLEQFWDSAQADVDASLLTQSVVQCLNGRLPPLDLIVIPWAVDRSWLLKSPLRFRTVNCLRQARVFDQDDPTTVGDLMKVKNFGITSLIDLMCVLEAGPPFPGLLAIATTSGESVTVPEEAVTLLDDEQMAWMGLLKSFKILLAEARDFYGATTVGDVCSLDVARLTKTVGVSEALNEVSISSIIGDRSLTGDRSICSDFLMELESFIEQLSEVQLLILYDRILADKPRRSCRDIGDELGVTREAIRRRTLRLNTRLNMALGSQLDTISALFKRLLDPVVSVADLDLTIRDVFANQNLKIGFVPYRLIRQRLGYSCNGDTALSPNALHEVEKLKDASQTLADDVGLIDENELLQTLSHSRWERHWEDLLVSAGLVRIGEQLALRDTKTARAKAALLDLNRHATKDEIATISGLPVNQISKYLGNVSSIVRVDKLRWGLDELVDDVYEGISAGIVNLINESGGTAPLEWVVSEMKRQFGSKEGSVRAYAHSAQFVIENDFIRLADNSDIRLADLDEVITGRDSRGYPYWTFTVHESYFRGYSLVGVPPEIAVALDCEPNSRTTAEVLHPVGVGNLSVIWRLTSLTGAQVGFLAEPLRRLNALEGMKVRLVVRGTGLVELRLE